MDVKRFSGLYTALITPFTKNGDVDEEAMCNIIEHQIREGIDGLVPCGTTGESPCLSHDEHDRVIALTVEATRNRVPVIAGTGSNSTAEAIRLSQHAEASGVDAVLLVNPYYNKPTQKGLYLHFKAIAESIGIPCILYNIKGRTAVNLATDTLVHLANDCPNIIAVKEASGSLDQMKDVISRRLPGFSVLSGDDNMAIDLIEAGGDGVISVASNLIPGMLHAMIHQALGGDIVGSRVKEHLLAPFFAACFCETNPIPIKTAMAYYHWCEETFRLPMCPLEDEKHRQQILDALASLNLSCQ